VPVVDALGLAFAAGEHLSAKGPAGSSG